ncbi:MAG: ABC transporter ATP-binding protein, partial [Eubacterium sp.]
EEIFEYPFYKKHYLRTMIECKNIKKSYGELQVLKGINLKIAQGEIVSIVGASGAGKSTLLQIMGSLLHPDNGEVIIDGVNICALSSDKLSVFRNKKIGFVFQFHHLLPEFTALENVMMPALIAKTNEKEARARAAELLTDLGLKERITHKPAQMSGGEQQRVAVARALINNPAVLFADEPSGNLDSKNKEELHNLFFDLRKKYGQTIVIVTHEKDLAQMCDRCLEMKDGAML